MDAMLPRELVPQERPPKLTRFLKACTGHVGGVGVLAVHSSTVPALSGVTLSPRKSRIRTKAGLQRFGIGQLQGRTDRQPREVRYLRVCVGQAAPGTAVAQVFA